MANIYRHITGGGPMINLIKTIKKIIGRKSKILILPVILSCIDSLLHMFIFAIMIMAIINLVSTNFTMQKLGTYSILLLGLFLLRAILYSITYVQTQYRGADITAELRLSLGEHIRSLNLGYFNKNSIGRLTSTLTTDISDFELVLTHSFSEIFRVIFFTILSFVFAFSIDWHFSIVILMIVMISLPLAGMGGKVAKKTGAALRHSVNNVISRIVEYINGIKTFKLYNLTGEKFERLDQSFKALKKESIKLELSVMPFSNLFAILTSFIIPVALIMGTNMLKEGSLSVQNFIVVIMIGISISNMMVSLGSLFPEMNYWKNAAENILMVQEEKPLESTTKFLDVSSYDIRFDKVGFRYTDDVDVLKEISFETKQGTTTALVGPSGSGKTTIISLISRFWDVTSGAITIDGQNISNISPDGLTSQMAVVFQDVYLFNDTIVNNIRVGKPDATMEEVIYAAKAAQCHEFIIALENGYNTLVGEGGSTLSGGEKQRISIARAFIKDSSIVLLDESTSSLDADNEVEINKALDQLMLNKTVIVIAHRLNTIKSADNILVLDQGEIKEQGTHQDLLAQGGWYARMIEEQDKARNWVV